MTSPVSLTFVCWGSRIGSSDTYRLSKQDRPGEIIIIIINSNTFSRVICLSVFSLIMSHHRELNKLQVRQWHSDYFCETKPSRPYLFFVFAHTIIDGNCDIYKMKLEYYYIYNNDVSMFAYKTQTQVVLPR